MFNKQIVPFYVGCDEVGLHLYSSTEAPINKGFILVAPMFAARLSAAYQHVFVAPETLDCLAMMISV